MKLKQLFCRHKKLTAVGIYEKPSKSLYVKPTVTNIYIACKCDKCQKELEYVYYQFQELRKSRKKQINIDKVFNHELWGKWW